jgi:hypothetical protein
LLITGAKFPCSICGTLVKDDAGKSTYRGFALLLALAVSISMWAGLIWAVMPVIG